MTGVRRVLFRSFLGCLKEAFRTQVEHSLNIQLAKDSKKKSVDNEARHPEDPYDILEVIKMAETIAGCAQGVTSSDMTRHGVNATEARATCDSWDSHEPHTQAAPSYNIKLEEVQRWKRFDNFFKSELFVGKKMKYMSWLAMRMKPAVGKVDAIWPCV